MRHLQKLIATRCTGLRRRWFIVANRVPVWAAISTSMPVIALLVLAAVPITAQQWIQLNPSGGSPTRAELSAVFNRGSDQMVIFGGGNPSPLNDVWRLSHADGVESNPSWLLETPSGTPPTPRFGQTTVYNATRDRMTIFGGDLASGCSNEVWVLVNAAIGSPSWSKIAPIGPPPVARHAATAVYHRSSNKMVVFGGFDCVALSPLNDVWVLSNADGLGPTPIWTQLTPSGGPSPRYGHTAVYDAARDRMTIFGGAADAFARSADNQVWVLKSATGPGSWEQLFPTGGPPSARTFASAIYNRAHNRMTIFGGGVGVGGVNAGVQNDVWVLHHANGLPLPTAAFWKQTTSSGGPPPARWAHSAIYDRTTNRMTIFAGSTNQAFYFGDVWVLTNAN